MTWREIELAQFVTMLILCQASQKEGIVVNQLQFNDTMFHVILISLQWILDSP